MLWLWCRPAAVALTGPLAWEPPYAVSAALKSKKKKEEEEEEEEAVGGVPAVAQLVKNSIAAAQVAAEARVQSWTSTVG